MIRALKVGWLGGRRRSVGADWNESWLEETGLRVRVGPIKRSTARVAVVITDADRPATRRRLRARAKLSGGRLVGANRESAGLNPLNARLLRQAQRSKTKRSGYLARRDCAGTLAPGALGSVCASG